MSKYANLYPAVGEMALGVIRAAWPVTAYQIKAAALTANWLVARGAVLVVDGGHCWPEGGAQSRTLNYRYRTDDAHNTIAAAICVSMQSSAEGVDFMPVTIGSLSLLIGTRPGVIQIAFPNLGAGETDWALTFDWDGTVGVLLVHSIILYECPEVNIQNTGVNIVEPGSMIYDGYANRESIAGLERVTKELQTGYFRRGGLFNWSSGYSSGVNTASTSYQSLHSDGIKPAIQTRLMYNGETVRSVRCAIFVIGFGNVRVTMTSGDSVTFTVAEAYGEGAGVWIVDDLDVETDDPSRWDTDGGIRGGTRDEITIEYKADSGEQVFLLGVSIWDAPGD